MEIERMAIPDLLLLKPRMFGDRRGFFLESYRREELLAFGADVEFVQDNWSGSRYGVLRGLHYQLPAPQAKLVRAIRGEIYDLAVDIRVGSPWFGKFCGVRLSEENYLAHFIPEGFAHGFYVLSGYAEVMYKCSDYYRPEYSRGIAWNDPAIGVDWPIENGGVPVLSDRDKEHSMLADISEDILPKYRPAAS
ncbi:MAG: dTDP-4-dehydrorhamnose 3,5-epimerase [Planctomycetota bacterium]|nr:dTDP-4-dehydrorhamnose 3,5-epimerase [Planctomycetota bacterium]